MFIITLTVYIILRRILMVNGDVCLKKKNNIIHKNPNDDDDD